MEKEKENKKTLTPFEIHVIEKKGTEPPFSGLYTDTDAAGVYACKRCSTPLYRSADKFHSHCGWPSFDDEIKGTVEHKRDADGRRTEILCKNCGAHLGHVFAGERLTEKNLRHCVNSVSLDFKPASDVQAETALFAGGSFYVTDYFLGRLPGVVKTQTGYVGNGEAQVEAVEVSYDPVKISYESLLRSFFETHNLAQTASLYPKDEGQNRIAASVLQQLKTMGHKVQAKIEPNTAFRAAAEDQQRYFERRGEKPR